MKLLLLALLVAGCRGSDAIHLQRCDKAPVDFLRWADFPGNIGGARWIAPPQVDTIALDRHVRATWNGVPVSDTTLDTYLSEVAQLTPQPITTLAFDAGASCNHLGRIRHMMVQHLNCARSRRCFQGTSVLPVVN